jgi:hypothetical protein
MTNPFPWSDAPAVPPDDMPERVRHQVLLLHNLRKVCQAHAAEHGLSSIEVLGAIQACMTDYQHRLMYRWEQIEKEASGDDHPQG